MAYADSAIDYIWEIVGLDVDQRLMTVKYDPADSADSARSSVFLNLPVGADEFNISDLTDIANSQTAELNVVQEWDKQLEAVAANPTFDPSTLIGNVYSSRYKVRVEDEKPYYNRLTQECVASDSEGADEIRTSYSLSNLSDSDKAQEQGITLCNRRALWGKLAAEGKLDDVANSLGLNDSYDTYNSLDVSFVTSEKMQFGDSLADTVQSVLALNDSDWAAWILEAGINHSGIY